jgi:MFS family permease
MSGSGSGPALFHGIRSEKPSLADTDLASGAPESPSSPPTTGASSSNPFRAFKSRSYAYYWFGSLLSITSFFMLLIARGWLVFEMTASPLQVTLVATASQVPSLVLSIFGGVLADRINRKTILVVAEFLNFVTLVILALLVVTDSVTIEYLLILATINGINFALAFPARTALVPSLVPPHDIANGVALASMVFSGAQLLGPFMAGALLAAFAPGVVFFASAGAAALAIPLFYLLQPREADMGHEAQRGSILGSIMEGMAYIRQRDILLGLMAIGFVVIVFGMPYQTVLPVFADEVLDAGKLGLGYLGTAGGVGALAGSLLVARFTGFGQMRFALAAGVLGMGVFIVLFSLSVVLWISLAMALIVGFFFQMVMTANFALLQVSVPDRLRGRVMSIRFILFGLSPLGVIPLGIAAEIYGTPMATAWTGAACAGGGMLVLLLFPVLRRRANPDMGDLSAGSHEQDPTAEVEA